MNCKCIFLSGFPKAKHIVIVNGASFFYKVDSFCEKSDDKKHVLKSQNIIKKFQYSIKENLDFEFRRKQ